VSILSFPALGAVPKPAIAATTDEHPRLRSGWIIGKNENCLALTKPDEFGEWAGELLAATRWQTSSNRIHNRRRPR
jgi:hypothetical protein